VWVTDLSFNGTFLNRVAIGKQNKVPLSQGDVLALVSKRYARDLMCYIFHDDRYFFGTELSQKFFPRDEVYQHFDFQQEIGRQAQIILVSLKIVRGVSSVVKLAIHKQTGRKFAIKVIDKKKICKDQKSTEQLRTEIKILRKVRHDNIISYQGMFDGDQFLYIILEYAPKGELFDQIIQLSGRMSETEVRNIFRQLLQAVAYLHSKGITHRDIKPENILLDQHGKIKLSDFGLAKFLEASQMAITLCGTPQYVAPEIIRIGTARSRDEPLSQEGYSTPVDMWSLGVSLFFLLTGELPFQEEDRFSLFQQIEKGRFSKLPKNWKLVSDEAKDLLSKLLDVNSATRITANDSLNHCWFHSSVVSDHALKRCSEGMELLSLGELRDTKRRKTAPNMR